MVMNASTAPRLKVVAKARATNASASEQIDSRVAIGIRVTIEPTGWPPTAVRSARGTRVWAAAVKRAPRTTKKMTSKYSSVAWASRAGTARADGVGARSRAPPLIGGNAGARPPARPTSRPVSRPIDAATLRVMLARRATTRQSPWKATAVASSTTGLTTGAASTNATTACHGTPLAARRRASGMTPQSQTGATKPNRQPTSTAGSRRRGIQREIADSGR